jgi:hypothetical protein
LLSLWHAWSSHLASTGRAFCCMYMHGARYMPGTSRSSSFFTLKMLIYFWAERCSVLMVYLANIPVTECMVLWARHVWSSVLLLSYLLIYYRWRYKINLICTKLRAYAQNKKKVSCKIWGFHGGDYEEYGLLGCGAV